MNEIILEDIHGQQTKIKKPDTIFITLDLQTMTIDLSTKKDNKITLIHELSIDSLNEIINIYQEAL